MHAGTVHMSKWPVHSDLAQIAAFDMLDTHWAVPVAAYDTNQHLIEPGNYRRYLQGALAEIHFGLSHCGFKNNHTYTADIDTIRVLCPPPPSVNVATKRKLPSTFKSPISCQQVMWFRILFRVGVSFPRKYCQCFHCFFPQKFWGFIHSSVLS